MQTGYRCVVNTLGKHWIMCITLMLFVKLRPLVTLYLFLFLLQQMLSVANVFFRCVFSRCLFRLFVTIFIFHSFPAAVCHHENNDPFPFTDDYLSQGPNSPHFLTGGLGGYFGVWNFSRPRYFGVVFLCDAKLIV